MIKCLETINRVMCKSGSFLPCLPEVHWFESSSFLCPVWCRNILDISLLVLGVNLTLFPLFSSEDMDVCLLVVGVNVALFGISTFILTILSLFWSGTLIWMLSVGLRKKWLWQWTFFWSLFGREIKNKLVQYNNNMPMFTFFSRNMCASVSVSVYVC